MKEEETLDGINRTYDDWVEIQLEDNSVRPTKVVDKLMKLKGLELKEAWHIVERIDRNVRRRKAIKESMIGGLFLLLCLLSLFVSIYAVIGCGLFGILKLGNGIYTLIQISRETSQ